MLVKECMTASVELATTDTTLEAVARKMRDGDFGILPIGENGRLVGMLSDRDIVVRAVAEGRDLSTATAGDIMTKEVFYCFDDETVEKVAQNLGKNQIRRIPVLNREHQLVGILSLADLAQSEANEVLNGVMFNISRPNKQKQPPKNLVDNFPLQ